MSPSEKRLVWYVRRLADEKNDLHKLVASQTVAINLLAFLLIVIAATSLLQAVW